MYQVQSSTNKHLNWANYISCAPVLLHNYTSSERTYFYQVAQQDQFQICPEFQDEKWYKLEDLLLF